MSLPYMSSRKNQYKQQSVAFRGLNYTENTSEGDFGETQNLSTDKFPCISNRSGRTLTNVYIKPSAFFSFNGFVVVDGTDLIYKGVKVGTVSEGPKQFAVINTKLVIHPDKLYLDLVTSKLKTLDASITRETGVTVEFNAANTLEMASPSATPPSPVVFTYTATVTPTVMTYTALTWTGVAWTKTPAGGTEKLVTALANNDLIIPSFVTETGAYVIPTKTETSYTGEDNTDGVYFTVTPAPVITTVAEYKWEKYNAIEHTSEYTYYSQSAGSSGGLQGYGVGYATTASSYSFNSSNGTFTAVGSATRNSDNLSGTYIGGGSSIMRLGSATFNGSIYSYSSTIISATGPYYDSDTYYTKGSTFIGYVYGVTAAYPTDGYQAGYWYTNKVATGNTGTVTVTLTRTDYSVLPTFSDNFKAGDVVTVSGCTDIAANNIANLTILTVTDTILTFTTNAFTTGNETGAVNVARSVPSLEFICENDNRIWGVMGQQIYASALGDPTNFNLFAGTSTDSYTVAVGSAGDFTGICSYSGDVLFFKIDKLYRMFGDYPAEYVLQSYDIAGLQAGSHKSFAIINEVLYYKGEEGIYAYTGSTPSLISYNLGVSKNFNATAGTDGVKYYISMQNENDVWSLFVFDTLTRLWLKEDDTNVIQFAYQDGSLYMLDADANSVYLINDGASTEAVEWSAEFVPFLSGTLARKTHTKLYIRAEMETGSYLEAEVKFDDGIFAKVYSTYFTGTKTAIIAIPLLRCDSYTLRLSGTGNCTIKAIEKEYQVGSAV